MSRKLQYGNVVGVRVDDETLAMIEREAAKKGVDKGYIVRNAILHWLLHHAAAEEKSRENRAKGA